MLKTGRHGLSLSVMSRKKGKRAPWNAVVLKDTAFRLGLREVVGTIHGQQGITCFIAKDEDLAVPLSFNVHHTMYGADAVAYVRTSDNTVVFELGEHDKLLKDLNECAGEVDISDPSQLADVFEELKIKMIPGVASGLSSTVFSAAITVVAYILGWKLFPFLVIPALIAVWSCCWTISSYTQMNGSLIYDSEGNWIDLRSGETSLNDGTYRFPVRR